MNMQISTAILRLNFTTTSGKVSVYNFFSLDLVVLWRNVGVKWHVYCIQRTRFGLSAFNRQNPVIIVCYSRTLWLSKQYHSSIVPCSLMLPFATKVFFCLFWLFLVRYRSSIGPRSITKCQVFTYEVVTMKRLLVFRQLNVQLYTPSGLAPRHFNFLIKKCSFYPILVQSYIFIIESNKTES